MRESRPCRLWTCAAGMARRRTTLFETVFTRKIGDAYGLTSHEAAELESASGWAVIVLDKESRPPKRADGRLLFIESVATDPRYPPCSWQDTV